jgi:hypothetical protein
MKTDIVTAGYRKGTTGTLTDISCNKELINSIFGIPPVKKFSRIRRFFRKLFRKPTKIICSVKVDTSELQASLDKVEVFFK